ncbi:MAG: DUF4258 domain-containing protein [Candidatus Tectomicrobia bacterium]|nr:DUF4258 domain-containing protein [Candidatus Tectomicrobia bacterium]
MTINEIKQCIIKERYEFSFHAQQERLADDLDITDIETAILNGEMLEDYPDDPRGESCLLLGYVGENPLHIVAGWSRMKFSDQKALRIITVYVPQPPKWQTPRRRGGRER